MQHFYDGQIRRYLGQVIRMLSGFKYKAADGTETTVPVVYGDMTRQVGAIIRDNSENKIASAPRIAVYITGLSMDRGRLSDATFVSKVHIRQREKTFDSDGNVTGYTQQQGDNYTVERLMPTPYKLSIKADIWSTNTDQKLQIMEQILMLFNPSLEIQTTDNFIDWTSLSVVEITDITFSSRSIPVGAESEIDIGSLTFETPIWISPPTKVKKLGVVTDIVMNIFDDNGGSSFDGAPSTQEFINIGNYGVLVYNNTLTLLKNINTVESDDTSDTVFSKAGPEVSWQIIFDQYPGKFRNDISQIFLLQENGNKVVGRLMRNPMDENDSTVLYVNWDQDTFPTNTPIDSDTLQITRGTIDAVIDPQRYNPRPRLNDGTLGYPAEGTRYLILESIGDQLNDDGPDAWKSRLGADFLADANDIIEWTGNAWEIVLSQEERDTLEEPIYVTNLRTGIQYKFFDDVWSKSFEGEYSKGQWRLVF
jgi:hypothetical protein